MQKYIRQIFIKEMNNSSELSILPNMFDCSIYCYFSLFNVYILNMLTSFKLLNGELNSDMNHTPNLDLKTRKIFIYIELRCMYIRLHVAQTHAHPIVAPLKKAY